MTAGITQDALDTITFHARTEHPRECCGLLVGTPQAILRAVPVENVAADPFREYEVPAASHIAEIKRCREQGLAIVGAYHSHPHSAPEPSPTDLAMAFSEFLFVIAGPVIADQPLEVRAYVLEGGAFVPVELSLL